MKLATLASPTLVLIACILFLNGKSVSAQTILFNNGYINLSKKTTGGVVETGDILELKATIRFSNSATPLYAARYVDNIPSNTVMLNGPGDSIRLITNEGLTYKAYTPAAGDDPATYNPSPGSSEYNIRVNLGSGNIILPDPPVNTTGTESSSATGRISTSNIPNFNNGILFAVAVRVEVTGNPGDIIQIFPGRFIFQRTAGGPDTTHVALPYEIMISDVLDLCSNATGVNIAEEYGGTFSSGTTLNRPTDLTFPIPGYIYIPVVSPTQGVGDGQYGIVKNLSPRNSTNRDARRRGNCAGGVPFDDCDNRMFTYFFIDGDHTSTNDALGNLPPAEGDSAGYMLLVNNDYISSVVYRQTLTGLCPNTYYEFSAWVRNVCPNCGRDSAGRSTNRPGVLPNLSFSIDDIDRYSTGEIDTFGWLKKGFLYVTGPTQTSLSFAIRSNSQGGGGNDWAIDDISVATCLPSMSYSPTLSPTTCRGNTVEIRDTVRSFFPNYTNYKWQRSTDAGATYTDIAGETGNATATLVAGKWEYVTTYVVPNTQTTSNDSGNKYRVIVATTPDNLLDASCQTTDGISIVNLVVLDCDYDPLRTDLLSFTGTRENSFSKLSWTTSSETEALEFGVERSTDGRNFSVIGFMKSYGNSNAATNTYFFTDTAIIAGKVFYRVAMINKANEKEYSRTIQFTGEIKEFTVGNVVNPFVNSLLFDVTTSSGTNVNAALISLNGIVLQKQSYPLSGGYNSLKLRNLEALPAGVYLLQVTSGGKIITKKVMKY
jgi:hypothetical protein